MFAVFYVLFKKKHQERSTPTAVSDDRHNTRVAYDRLLPVYELFM